MNPVSVIVTYDDGDLPLTNMSIRLLEIERTLGSTPADSSGWSFSAPLDTSGSQRCEGACRSTPSLPR